MAVNTALYKRFSAGEFRTLNEGFLKKDQAGVLHAQRRVAARLCCERRKRIRRLTEAAVKNTDI